MKKNIWYRIRGYLAAGFAIITCPCHLVLALPLLLSITAGSAVGAFLEKNYYSIIAVSFIVFIAGLILALRWLGRAVFEDEDTTTSPRQLLTLMNRQHRAGSLQQDK